MDGSNRFGNVSRQKIERETVKLLGRSASVGSVNRFDSLADSIVFFTAFTFQEGRSAGVSLIRLMPIFVI